MPSKGFQLFTYISFPGIQVKYSVPGTTLTRSDPKQFFNDHLEVDKKNIKGSPFNFDGRFQFDVVQGANTIFTQWCDVNTLTGNISRGSDLREMDDQVSYVTDKLIITYGMYDAANTGAAGLPKSNQVWVTVHENRSRWMGEFAPPESASASKPFSRLILPCAHDVGMNSMQTVEAILMKAARPFIGVLKAVDGVVKVLSDSMTDDLLISMAPNIIQGLAITQKDTLPNILAIGARYFEFRPAHLYKALIPLATIPDRLYFHHGPIPGMAFEQYLYDCVNFLTANPTEIITTQLRWDGVPADCAKPSDAEIADYIAAALKPTNGSIVAGNLDDMQHLTIEQLRTQRKRLLIFSLANQFSTYTDAGNATLTGDSIVAEFNQLTPASQTGKALTLLQCQATATNLKPVVAYSVLTANVSNSCLLATKATCDSKTLPWIRDRALGVLTAQGQSVAVMNDFVDGATVDVALGLSVKRLLD